MAGCFGSHPFDRAMERQLMNHLGQEADYESMCEELCKDIPEDLWDKHEDWIFKVIDKHIAVVIEKDLLSMTEAKQVLLWMVQRYDASKNIIHEG